MESTILKVVVNSNAVPAGAAATAVTAAVTTAIAPAATCQLQLHGIWPAGKVWSLGFHGV